MTPPPRPILVLGIGNTLMSDDGVGVRLVQHLQSSGPNQPGVEYLDAGTCSFVLLPRIQDCGALLILDAAQLGAPPGTIRSLVGPDMDEFLKGARCSVHEVGIRDLLDLARLTEALPERRGFIGIQPYSSGWGEQLSPAVAAALPAAAAQACSLITTWSD